MYMLVLYLYVIEHCLAHREYLDNFGYEGA